MSPAKKRKGQPGYTQDKDQRGHTYWKRVDKHVDHQPVGGSKNDVVSDYETQDSAQSSSVSVFDEDFTEELIERYDCDPRDVDERRCVLMNNVSHARKRYDSAMSMLESAKNRKKKYAREDNVDVYDSAISKESVTVDKRRDELNQEQDALNAFNRENPVEWPQYWLVSGGHLHTSTSCHSLTYKTQLYLCPQASGLEENEAIELGGSRICTHCIPDAPVDIEDRPSHVWTEDEKEELKRKERAAQAKAQREKEKEEKEKRKAQREAKRQASGNVLPEAVVVPHLDGRGTVFSATDVDSIQKLTKQLKQSTGSLLGGTVLAQKQDFDNHDERVRRLVDNASYGPDSLLTPFKDRAELVTRHAGGHMEWLATSCYGDINYGIENYQKIHDCVQMLAETKDITFDKALDTFLSKRSVTSYKKNAYSSAKEFFDVDEQTVDDVFDKTAPIIREMITDPDKVRDYLK